MYLLFAGLSALFAGVTAVLAKCGIRRTDSDVATALRTGVVLLFAWAMVFLVGAQGAVTAISGRSLLFLLLSGLSTGASWLCYFKALSLGEINKVVPVDKSSIVLTVLFAMAFLGERSHWVLRLLCLTLIATGTLLMIERKVSEEKRPEGPWLIYAALSAVFAALTSILAKVGVEGVESNVATALRTFVVLLMAWGIVLGRKKMPLLRGIDRRELCFIVLSGVATGASWLCYYRAIQLGDVSIVAPIDKLSILVTVAFSAVVFKERLTRKAAVGLIFITVGTLAMAIWS